MNAYIPEYTQASRFNHEPKRTRKLLMRKHEIAKLAIAAQREGMTLIPLKCISIPKASPSWSWALPRARSCTTSAKPKSSATGSATRQDCCEETEG